MRTTVRRAHRLFLLSAAAWIGTAGAALAQASGQDAIPTSSLPAVMTRVPAGDVVYVTDAKGATLKGRFRAATETGVQLSVGNAVRELPAASVRRIDHRRPDSPLTGILIGAGIGTIPGIYWLVVDPNECDGLCPADYAAIAVGAGIGGLIDAAIHKRETVYLAGPAAAKTVTVAPLLTPRRQGLQVTVTF